MKKVIKMLIIVVIIAVFTLPAAASEDTDKHLDSFEDVLPDGFSGITDDTDRLVSMVGIDALLSEIVSALGGGGKVLALFAALLGGIALAALASRSHEGHSSFVGAGVGVILSAMLLSTVTPIFSEVTESISEATDFFAACIPVTCAVSVSGGGVDTAAAQAVGMNLTVSIVSRLLLPVFTSLISFSLATGSLSALGSSSADAVTSGARSFFLWLVGISCAVIMGAISLQTVVASAADSARMRAAKYAASSMIPVVGGTVAGSMATLASGLAYVKGIIGAGAVAVLVSIFLSPLVMLLLYRLAVTLAASVSELLSVGVTARLYRSYARCFDLVIAVYTTSVLLYVFEIVLFAVSGVAVA